MSQQTKVVTGINTRLSYANVWEPKSINGGKEKYSVSLIIPKSDQKTVAAIEKAIDAAIQEGIGKFGGKKPNKATLKLPLRDGDVERDDVAYQDSYFINANSITAPHKSWTSMSNPFSTPMKFTVAAMPGYQSTSTPLIPMATVELPVGSATCKRFGMGSRLVVMLVPAMTLPPLMTIVMMIS